MKFGKTLYQNIVPEWQACYVSYSELKKQLKLELAKKGDERGEDFNRMLVEEIKKAEQFYSQQLNQLSERFEALKLQTIGMTTAIVKTRDEAEHAKHLLATAFTELAHAFALLKSFGIYNYLACVKILKKHDKVLHLHLRARLMPVVKKMRLHTRTQLEQMSQTAETLFSEMFTDGNRHAAMRKLRVQVSRVTYAQVFRFGLFLGLAIAACWSSVRIWVENPTWAGIPNQQLVLSTWRAFGLLNLAILLLSVNELGWVRSRINYSFIFEMRSIRDHSPFQLWESAAFLFLMWSVSLLAFLSVVRGNAWVLGIPWWVFPLLLEIVLLAYVINPFPIFDRESRFWLLKHLFRVVTAPFYKVVFSDFFLADQLNSLVLLLYDLEYVLCYYFADAWWGTTRCTAANTYVRPVLAVLPALWRFLQCLRRYRDTGEAFPHLVNACKYSMTFFVVLFSNLSKNYPTQVGYLVIWAVISAVGTTYAYLWDITMDWDVVTLRGGVRFLTRRLMFRRRWVYWFAIVTNGVMRLAWVLVLSPIPAIVDGEYFLILTGTLELLRRFQWNFFRMENEHVGNCGQFRAVHDVPLPFVLDRKRRALRYRGDNEAKRSSDDEEIVVLSPEKVARSSLFSNTSTLAAIARTRNVADAEVPLPRAEYTDDLTFRDLDSAMLHLDRHMTVVRKSHMRTLANSGRIVSSDFVSSADPTISDADVYIVPLQRSNSIISVPDKHQAAFDDAMQQLQGETQQGLLATPTLVTSAEFPHQPLLSSGSDIEQERQAQEAAQRNAELDNVVRERDVHEGRDADPDV